MIKIGKKSIGENNSVFIIAELSANHNKDYQIAKKTIKAAKLAGADAVKFQNFIADKIVSKKGFENLKVGHQASWGKSVYDVYEQWST